VSVGAKVVVLPMNGHSVAQTQRPAPAPVLRQRVSDTYQSSDAPRPLAAVPDTDRPPLAYGWSASRLY
jgi:hypothetical protein